MSHDAEADFRDDLVPVEEPWPVTEVSRALPGRLTAEACDTFALVAAGLGTVYLVQPFNQGLTLVPGLSFGLALYVVFVALHRVSGAHLNPAVTLGMWAAGRFPGRDIALYVLAQVIGAIAAGATLLGVASLRPGGDVRRTSLTMVANGWGDHSTWDVTVWEALGIETVLVAAFIAVVLAVTSVTAHAHHAPAAIGITFGALVTFSIPLTNGAINPARSTAAAVFAEPWALGQLWTWWLAAIVAGVVVGLAFRAFGPSEDLEDPKTHTAPPVA
jgi:aquaporin Z